jgi:DNA-binding transcriptional regulator YiaG
MAALKKAAIAPSKPVSIESEFRALDQRVLDLMRRLDTRSTRDWMNLIACTQRAGLTLRDIAESLPCSVSTVSRWQAGKAAPPVFLRPPLRDMLVKLVETRLAADSARHAA